MKTNPERKRCLKIIDFFLSYVKESPEPKYGGFKDKEGMLFMLKKIKTQIKGGKS